MVGKRTGLGDPAEVLAELATGRRAVIRVLAASPIGGPDYRAAKTALAAIDQLAGALTGDAEILWARAPKML